MWGKCLFKISLVLWSQDSTWEFVWYSDSEKYSDLGEAEMGPAHRNFMGRSVGFEIWEEQEVVRVDCRLYCHCDKRTKSLYFCRRENCKVCGEVHVVGANESAIESNDSCYRC